MQNLPVHLYAFSVIPITIFPLAVMYNIAFWDFGTCALRGQKISPLTVLPKDTTTKADKDANCTILTSEMYRKVNELNAENLWVQKNIRETEIIRKKKIKALCSNSRPQDDKTTSPSVADHSLSHSIWLGFS